MILSVYDLAMHTSDTEQDVTQKFKEIYLNITGIKPLESTHYPATIGHLMGGYDAGYYGYLWSNVYAMDLYTQFDNGRQLSVKVGYRYRKDILEKGNSIDEEELVTQFLGRKSNSEAYFKFLK